MPWRAGVTLMNLSGIWRVGVDRHIYGPKSSAEKRDPTLAAVDHMPFDDRTGVALEVRQPISAAPEMLEGWDLDICPNSLTRLGLKPLTADELEALVTKFPDVLPHVYVRPDVILIGTAARE